MSDAMALMIAIILGSIAIDVYHVREDFNEIKTSMHLEERR